MSKIKEGLKAKVRFPFINGLRTIEELMELNSKELLAIGQPIDQKVSMFSNGSRFKTTSRTKEQERL
jgi:hypothetical protein